MIKADIIKRIKAIERQVLDAEIPNLVYIYYDWQSKDWVVDESRMESGDKKQSHYRHYKDYIFHPQFEGIAILDFLDCPDEFQTNLHSIRMGDFKRDNNLKNCGISLEAVLSDREGKLEHLFNVIVREYV